MAQGATRKRGRVPGARSSNGGAHVYNADEKAQKRLSEEIIIGGEKFHPRPQTMKLLDDWNEVTPTPEQMKDPTRDTLANFRDVYKQVRIFLHNDAGQHPEEEFLYEKLELVEAVDLLAMLQPFSDEQALRDLGKVGAATNT